MAEGRPNLKYDHVFVIVRIDYDLSLENAVTVTKAFWTKEAAESEVVRLNELNKDKQCSYSWEVARLERKA